MDLLKFFFRLEITRFTVAKISVLLDIVREQIASIFDKLKRLRNARKKFITTNRDYGVPDLLKFHQGLVEHSELGSGIAITTIHNSIGVYSRIQCYASGVVILTDWQMNDSLGRMSHEI